jgi:ribosomal-protein-alanine N-acetyltransferase
MVHRQRRMVDSSGSGAHFSAVSSENMIPDLHTERLWLRTLELADAEQAQLLFPHWEIVRYLSNVVPWPYPPDGAYKFYRDSALPAIARGDEWHWSLRLKSEPDRMIGSISLIKGKDINRGFWLGLPWHGQGLMTEACDAVTDYWFNTLRLPVLRAPKAIANAASRRISEKSNMRIVAIEEREYVCGRLPTEVWEITAEEWRTRKC